MLDHKIMIGGEDVSNEVIKVTVQQAIDSDSEPGKIAISLANRAQKFTNHWPPQATPIKVILFNWVYNSEAERVAAGSHAEAEYLVATGHMTNLKTNQEEALVDGECDLGHLADAIPKDFEGIEMPITAKQCLEIILSWHDDEQITWVWDPKLPDKTLDKVPYNADNTYQDVCEDLASIVGAVYYFGEDNVLYFMNPTSNTGLVDLDPHVIDPDQTTSLNSFRNVVTVVGNQSLAASGEDHIDPEGATAPGSEPIIGYAEDLDSIDEVGPLIAPAEYAYNLKTQAAVDARAKQLLELYKMYRNAETKVTVAGIVPPLMSIVSYSPFQPISDVELAKANSTFAARLKELQEQENARALKQDRLPRTIEITDRVRGIVIAKRVEYSIDGLTCEVTISPGMLDMSSTVVTNEEVGEGEGGEGQQYPYEEE